MAGGNLKAEIDRIRDDLKTLWRRAFPETARCVDAKTPLPDLGRLTDTEGSMHDAMTALRAASEMCPAGAKGEEDGR